MMLRGVQIVLRDSETSSGTKAIYSSVHIGHGLPCYSLCYRAAVAQSLMKLEKEVMVCKPVLVSNRACS